MAYLILITLILKKMRLGAAVLAHLIQSMPAVAVKQLGDYLSFFTNLSAPLHQIAQATNGG